MSESGSIPPLAVAFGADHACVALRDHRAASLCAEGFGVHDLGTQGTGSVDDPDVPHLVAGAVTRGAVRLGVLALDCLHALLGTGFEGGRHVTRPDKLAPTGTFAA